MQSRNNTHTVTQNYNISVRDQAQQGGDATKTNGIVIKITEEQQKADEQRLKTAQGEKANAKLRLSQRNRYQTDQQTHKVLTDQPGTNTTTTSAETQTMK
jgi:hypothetical protein